MDWSLLAAVGCAALILVWVVVLILIVYASLLTLRLILRLPWMQRLDPSLDAVVLTIVFPAFFVVAFGFGLSCDMVGYFEPMEAYVGIPLAIGIAWGIVAARKRFVESRHKREETERNDEYQRLFHQALEDHAVHNRYPNFMSDKPETDPLPEMTVNQLLGQSDEPQLLTGTVQSREELLDAIRDHQEPWLGYRKWFAAVALATFLSIVLWNTIPPWSPPLVFAIVVGGKEIVRPTPPCQLLSPARRVRDFLVFLVDLGVIALCVASIWRATGAWWGGFIGFGVAWLLVGFISPRGQGYEN
jgi:energy-converting hydrogenase Eha subunit A